MRNFKNKMLKPVAAMKKNIYIFCKKTVTLQMVASLENMRSVINPGNKNKTLPHQNTAKTDCRESILITKSLAMRAARTGNSIHSNSHVTILHVVSPQVRHFLHVSG